MTEERENPADKTRYGILQLQSTTIVKQYPSWSFRMKHLLSDIYRVIVAQLDPSKEEPKEEQGKCLIVQHLSDEYMLKVKDKNMAETWLFLQNEYQEALNAGTPEAGPSRA